MLIYGADRQQEQLFTKYPFSDTATCNLGKCILNTDAINALTVYIRNGYTLPLHVGAMDIVGQDLVLTIMDHTNSNPLIVTVSSDSRIVVLKDSYELASGIMDCTPQLYKQLYSVIKFWYGGHAQFTQQVLLLNCSTYIPMADTSINALAASDQVVHGDVHIYLQHNVCYDDAAHTISVYSDLPGADSTYIQGSATAASCYVDKHLLLSCHIRSDLRVATQSNIITLIGASDV